MTIHVPVPTPGFGVVRQHRVVSLRVRIGPTVATTTYYFRRSNGTFGDTTDYASVPAGAVVYAQSAS